MTNDKPLITFAVSAFNQERFVREAVAAAFAQTYSPLEIILSDDCSKDRTYEIMREMAAGYQGPHRIILNRNAVQKSIGGHLNRLIEISHGELIVGAAGDDISLPQRTQLTYQAWEKSGRRATSIHSNYVQIDESSAPIQQIIKANCEAPASAPLEQEVAALDYVRTLEPIVFGCAHGFSRELFRTFGPLADEVIHEDNALAFRSILGGRLVYINEALVKYRVHGNNAYVRSRNFTADLRILERQERRILNDFKNRETMYRGFLADLEVARELSLVGESDFEKVRDEAARRLTQVALKKRFFESGLLAKFRILRRLRREGLTEAESRMLTRRLVPQSVLLRLRLARGFVALSLGKSAQ
jgi:glycosyltransferase involved in cell wall biosynthesis